MKRLMLVFLLISILAMQNLVLAKDKKRGHGDEWKEEYWDGPCKVKVESKKGKFKKEIKCKDGIGAWWGGEWKKEFFDGSCKVKQEAKHDEFKEEVECKDKD